MTTNTLTWLVVCSTMEMWNFFIISFAVHQTAANSYKIEVVNRCHLLGEGPHWSAERQELFYVDLPGKKVHRYIPATGEDYFVSLSGRTTFVVPMEGEKEKFLIGLERNLSLLEWDGVSPQYKSLKTVHSVEPNFPKNRFNDAKCDPQGRLWAGTMDTDETIPGYVTPERGSIYRLDLAGQLCPIINKINISNGFAWPKDSSKMFYIDSGAFTVDVFDFNAKTGDISNRRVLFDLKKNNIPGLPDGMAIDADDNLWVAIFTGSRILKLHPETGALLQTIDFTGRSSKITSCAFGGKNLDELYVTSAYIGLTEEDLKKEPDAGALFKVTNLGAKGPSGGINYKGKLVIT